MNIRYILSDIEGTTTSITFVHDVLFPYSREALPAFVREHRDQPATKEYLAMVAETLREEGSPTREGEFEKLIDTLVKWIGDDRKHPGLKGLQGLVWKDGYEKGAFTAHIYSDVLPALREWKSQGLTLGIYSSGSVLAQKLLFAHTSEGDLSSFFSHFFDTAVGGKKDASSYRAIQRDVGVKADEILFLSDIEAELDAAKSAGFLTTQLLRPGTVASTRHPTAANFAKIVLTHDARIS